jgi:hypothetical protein
MGEKAKYECKGCGRQVEVDADAAEVPECCRRPMEKAGPLPACNLSETAEHSRLEDFGEPCDDGRGSE